MATVEAAGVTLGVEHFGDAAAPLVLLAGGTTMLSWPDALCEALARGELPWLQLLTHPEIWAFPGETMGQTMRAMLEAEKGRRLQQLAEDRIDLT